jgi:hypothetical protein
VFPLSALVFHSLWITLLVPKDTSSVTCGRLTGVVSGCIASLVITRRHGERPL